MSIEELQIKLKELLRDIKPGGLCKVVKSSELSSVFIEMYKTIPGPLISNEKIYLGLNGLVSVPLAECNNPRRFMSFNVGYSEYCSLPKQGTGACLHCQKKIVAKKDTSISGFNSPKFKETMKEKYGVSNISQTEKQKEYLRSICQFGTEEFKKTTNKTIIDKYGSIDNYKKKTAESVSTYYKNLDHERLQEHASRTKNGRLKASFNTKIKSFKKIEPLFDESCYIGAARSNVYEFKCNECNHQFKVNVYENKEPICPSCRALNYSAKSKQEDEFCSWVMSNITNLICIRSDRTVIKPYELDLYIPELKIAFEFNGVYWHQEKYVGKNKHQYKTLECRKNGVKLITVFSDDWKYKKDIVKRRIMHFLMINIQRTKIYARNCTIKEITPREAGSFIDNYHIQGNTTASIRLGLFFKDELLSVMTFSKSRYRKDAQYELIRMASKVHVPGANSKMFSYFVKTYKPESVISYADLSYGYGDGYLKLGFKFDGITAPNYSYVHVNSDKRENRQKYQKHLIVNETNKHLSASDIMSENGYYKVYGCGSSCYIWRENFNK